MTRRLGISIGRRELAAAGLAGAGARVSLGFSVALPRAPGTSIKEALEAVLAQLPADWHGADISIALSPADLACADCFKVPYRSEGEIEEIAPSLAEGRSGGYSAEELAVDVNQISVAANGSDIEVIALPQPQLEVIRAAVSRLPGAKLCLVTALPSALSNALSDRKGDYAFLFAGEGVLLSFLNDKPSSWRCFPVATATGARKLAEQAAQRDSQLDNVQVFDSPEQEIGLTGNLAVKLQCACAAAVAVLDPARSANLLRGAQDAPRNWAVKLRGPLSTP